MRPARQAAGKLPCQAGVIAQQPQVSVEAFRSVNSPPFLRNGVTNCPWIRPPGIFSACPIAS
jgi:hypothetical protein